MPAIDPSFAVSGLEWQVPGIGGEAGGVGGAEGVQGAEGTPESGGGFGGALANQLESLQGTQTEAAHAAQSLAAGTATDPESVVMAIERARLAMQLASQIRTKGVEALQDIFHTQV